MLTSDDLSCRYRYQLEAFVDKVKGRTPTNGWLDAEDSVANMEWIEKVYEKVCLMSSLADSTELIISLELFQLCTCRAD